MSSSPPSMERVPRDRRPTALELERAKKLLVDDLIAPDLRVLFCGINPGLYTAAIGHHFGRPGNRFWPALHKGGFSDIVLSPYDERRLLERGYGITNVVARATATAAELSDEEVRRGGRVVLEKVARYRPRILAVLGLMAYRVAFDRPKAGLGLQSERAGKTLLWVLPNPSGLNAHYQIPELGRLFGALRRAAEGAPRA